MTSVKSRDNENYKTLSSLILQERFKIKQVLSDFCFCVHHLDPSPFSKNLKKFISSEKPKKTDCGLGTGFISGHFCYRKMGVKPQSGIEF